MKQQFKKLLVVAGSVSALVLGCYGEAPPVESAQASEALTLDIPCAVDNDCPSGFECEVEVEHGTTTSFCKGHRSGKKKTGPILAAPPPSAGGAPAAASCQTDADCGAGMECETEVEHGVTTSFCKLHNEAGATGGTTSAGGRPSSSGGSTASGACASDADCQAGMECEIEIEHGVTTSFCKPHSAGGTGGTTSAGGGTSSSGGSTASGACASDADCQAGMECEIEIEHGVTTSFCKPHGGHGGKHK